MGRDEFGDDDLGPEDFEPIEVEPAELDPADRGPGATDPGQVETTDGAWESGGARRGRGWGRWLLLLLVIAVVAVVVQQLQPSTDPSAGPSPTGAASSSAPGGRDQPARSAGANGRASPHGAVVLAGLGRPLPGVTQGWSLFARGSDVVLHLDFEHEVLTTTTLPTIQSGGPVAFIATGAGAILRPLDSVAGYFVADGTRARPLTGLLARGGPVVPGPDTAHVWVDLGDADSGSIRLVDVDGRAAAPAIPLPRNASGWILPDGGGRPLVITTGGVYDVRPDGLRRVTTGVVLASGPTGWLVTECDARNTCTAKVVDRASGSRRSLAAFPERLDRASGMVSPDGSTAALVEDRAAGGSALWLVDLTTGRAHRVAVRSLPAPYPGSGSVVWSPDGRWVFVVDLGGQLRAVDSTTRQVRRLGPDLPEVSQLAVRTTDPPG